MSTKSFNFIFLAACIFLATTSPASANGYTFTHFEGMGTVARGINNVGQVVGSSSLIFDGKFAIHATVWNGTTPTDLGTLGGSHSDARGINNLGQVVGFSYTLGDSAIHATIWNGTTPTDLGTLGESSYATGINNSGQVVGNIEGGAAIWNGTTRTDFGRFGLALGINDVGQVAGVGEGTTQPFIPPEFGITSSHAYVWNGTTPTDLGTLGGYYSGAFAINNAGQVVGYSLDSRGATRAFIWNGTTLTALDTLDSSVDEAWAINNVGQVVGNSADHAVIWNGTTPTDLNDFLSVSEVNEGWVLYRANGINDNGWVVGQAHNTITNAYQGFLLTPTVPEPESYAMFMAGLGLMGFMARRRKNGQA